MLHLLSHQVSVSTVGSDALLSVDPEVEGWAYLVGNVLRRGAVHSSHGAPSGQLSDVELGHDIKTWWGTEGRLSGTGGATLELLEISNFCGFWRN